MTDILIFLLQLFAALILFIAVVAISMAVLTSAIGGILEYLRNKSNNE